MAKPDAACSGPDQPRLTVSWGGRRSGLFPLDRAVQYGVNPDSGFVDEALFLGLAGMRGCAAARAAIRARQPNKA